jgi:hypothetical protein
MRYPWHVLGLGGLVATVGCTLDERGFQLQRGTAGTDPTHRLHQPRGSRWSRREVAQRRGRGLESPSPHESDLRLLADAKFQEHIELLWRTASGREPDD